jgi:hypothetical protein
LNFSQNLGLVVAALSFAMGILWLMLVLELASSNINMAQKKTHAKKVDDVI